MAYGDFTAWMCGCGNKVDGLNDPLPKGWAIVWPNATDRDAFDLVDMSPQPGVYCDTCWGALSDAVHTASVHHEGETYRGALMGYGFDRRLADEIQRRTTERYALGRRYENVCGTRDALKTLIGAGLNHRMFPAGAPPDWPHVTMVLHPSALASGLEKGFYGYLKDLAQRYTKDVHLFWDESRWILIFIGGAIDPQDGEYSYYNGSHEFWVVFRPDGTSQILGAS